MGKERTKGFVFMASSLDGFVSREDHSIDWLMKYDSEGEDQGYDAFIKNIDVIVMGSGSFKTVLGFGQWPYKLPVIVMSSSLVHQDIPDNLKEKVTLSTLSPDKLMESLFKKGIINAYIDGGKLVQSFIHEGLIDEITITIIPILIGNGKRLFGKLNKDVDLKLIYSKTLKPGFVQNHYAVLKQ